MSRDSAKAKIRERGIMKKRWIVFALAAAVMLALAGCGKGDSDAGSGEAGNASADGGEETAEDGSGEDGQGETVTGKHHVEITVKDQGTIKVELDGDAAPITVANFLKLAGDGFYDGLTFHRIIEGFMMQGGDPRGDGTGGADENIKGEFSENGIQNDLSHTRGAISMARAADFDSASSQFFIVHADSTFLDGQYACFGYVTEGMEVVDAICDAITEEDIIPESNNTVVSESQPVIESIKVID